MLRKLTTIAVLMLLALGLFYGCDRAPGSSAEVGAPADAALKVTGNVDNEVGWTEAEVKAMTTVEVETTDKEGQPQTNTGVSINALLEEASVKGDATAVTFVADDGYSAELTLAEVTECADCIVAFRDSGGFSTVLPGFPGNMQVKGVVEIQVQ